MLIVPDGIDRAERELAASDLASSDCWDELPPVGLCLVAGCEGATQTRKGQRRAPTARASGEGHRRAAGSRDPPQPCVARLRRRAHARGTRDYPTRWLLQQDAGVVRIEPVANQTPAQAACTWVCPSLRRLSACGRPTRVSREPTPTR